MLPTLNELEIVSTLLALALLLGFAFVIGTIFEKIKAPRVVGEITGGILLGGTGFHALFPELFSKIFMAYEQEGKVLNIFYQLGLIFLMVLSGYNTKLEIKKKNVKTTCFLFVGATIIPMALAIPFVNLFKKWFAGSDINDIAFGLVFVIGVAITSIPVISKIFFEMGIMNTKFSNMVLTVATFQDLCLWILLNIATRIATTGEVKLWDMIVVVLITIGLFIIVKVLSNHAKTIQHEIKAINFYTVSFVVLLISCALMSLVGINIMYTAFLVGYVIKSFVGADSTTSTRMDFLGNFSFSFFIPIYFALVGIQINILHDFSIVRFLLFFVLAFGLEAVGTLFMLRFTTLNRATQINLAVTMNARGGPGIVLATVAYSYGIISIEFFTVLILTTMLSSMIAGYWLRRQQRLDSTIFMRIEKEN
ncbi:MAG: cation:proton antiporter [Lachnospiraceae bacterium]